MAARSAGVRAEETSNLASSSANTQPEARSLVTMTASEMGDGEADTWASVGYPPSILVTSPLALSKNRSLTFAHPPRLAIVNSWGGRGKWNFASTGFSTGR